MLTTARTSLANFSQVGMVIVAGKVAIGSTGAVGTKTGKGFAVTRTGVGLYTITLDGSGGCASILYAAAQAVPAAAGATQTVTVLTQTASARTITLQCNAAATVNVASELPSGSVLELFVVALTQ